MCESLVIICCFRKPVGGAYHQDDRADHGADCVGGHQHAGWMVHRIVSE